MHTNQHTRPFSVRSLRICSSGNAEIGASQWIVAIGGWSFQTANGLRAEYAHHIEIARCGSGQSHGAENYAAVLHEECGVYEGCDSFGVAEWVYGIGHYGGYANIRDEEKGWADHVQSQSDAGVVQWTWPSLQIQEHVRYFEVVCPPVKAWYNLEGYSLDEAKYKAKDHPQGSDQSGWRWVSPSRRGWCYLDIQPRR